MKPFPYELFQAPVPEFGANFPRINSAGLLPCRRRRTMPEAGTAAGARAAKQIEV